MIINYKDKLDEVFKDINTYGNTDERKVKMFNKLTEWITNGMHNRFEGLKIDNFDDIDE